MTTDLIPATTQTTDEKRGLALLKALGLDRVAPEQREIALAISSRYELDPMLRHLVLIEGRPFITRDGLLHVAHRSGVFDGIEVDEPRLEAGFWRTTATVFRKDMTRGFRYPGRYPEKGKNAAYAPEMAIKVAESMALRRAFDVAAPSAEEKWAEDAEREVTAPKPSSLADLARQRAEAVRGEPEPAQDAPSAPDEPEAPTDTADGPVEAAQAEEGDAREVCGAESDPALGDVLVCSLDPGHLDDPKAPRVHRDASGSTFPAPRKGGRAS